MYMCLQYTDADDYTGRLIVANVSTGVLSQSFRINIIDDNIVECSENFYVTITSVFSCGVTIGTSNNSEVTIIDNDSKYKCNNLCVHGYSLMYLTNRSSSINWPSTVFSRRK